MSSLKHSIYILFPLLFTGCARDPLATMPDFRIEIIDNDEIMRTGMISKGQSTMFVHFDSECLGCQKEARVIKNHIAELSKVNIYFISVQEEEKIAEFRKHFGFDKHSNVKFGRDLDTSLAKHFRSEITPFIAFYDKDKKLKAVFEGEHDLRPLFQTIREIQ